MKWLVGVGFTLGFTLLIKKYNEMLKKKKLEKKRDTLIKLLDFIKKLN